MVLYKNTYLSEFNELYTSLYIKHTSAQFILKGINIFNRYFVFFSFFPQRLLTGLLIISILQPIFTIYLKFPSQQFSEKQSATRKEGIFTSEKLIAFYNIQKKNLLAIPVQIWEFRTRPQLRQWYIPKFHALRSGLKILCVAMAFF